MRRALVCISAVALVGGCAPADQHGAIQRMWTQSHELNFERTQTHWKETGEDTIVLENTDFQTPRRIERQQPLSSATSIASREEILERSVTAVSHQYPGISVRLLSINPAGKNFIVRFQQVLEGLDIIGSTLSVKIHQSGQWTSTQGNPIAPSLLQDLSTALGMEDVDLEPYYDSPAFVVSARKVIYPRLSDEHELKIFVAKEFQFIDATIQAENILWVDLHSRRAVGAHTLNQHMRPVAVRGSILPNDPRDTPVEVLFPIVRGITSSGKSFYSSGEGYFSAEILKFPTINVRLENKDVVIANNAVPTIGANFNLNAIVGAENPTLDLDRSVSLEERNAFHWVTKAYAYVRETLRYDGMNYQMLVMTNFSEALDNANFFPLTKSLRFGSGHLLLKNTALSRDIILHEFGHALTHEIYGLQGSFEFAAMNEAFSDYFAATITNEPHIAEGAFADRMNIPYLRKVNNSMIYPDNFTGVRFHDDGQIFSGALWDLRTAIGPAMADAMIHEARLAQATSIYEFYRELLAIDEDHDDGDPRTPAPHRSLIRQIFNHRGIGHADVVFRQAPPENLTEKWSHRWAGSLIEDSE